MRSRLPQADVQFDPITGAPSSIVSVGGFLTSPAAPGGDGFASLHQFVNENAALFGHDATALTASKVTRDDVTARNGMRTVVWQQQVDGIPLYNTVFKANLTQDGAIIAAGSSFMSDAAAATQMTAEQRAALVAQPPIDAPAAVSRAAANIGVPIAPQQTGSAPLPTGAEKKQSLAAPGLSDVVAKLSWLPMDTATARLSWDVTLMSTAGKEMYQVLVDAQTGEVLLRRSLTADISNASYRVYADSTSLQPFDSPTPMSPGLSTPGSAQPAAATRNLITTPALDNTASPNGWIDDGGTATYGNNVDAHLDTGNTNPTYGTGTHATSATRNFDFTLDLTQDPTTYQNAILTSLFYACNYYHDKLYELGFTESAGNFQQNNFGKGGLGNDAVLADAQDGSGTNNANFSTPADGSPGRMQMYIFTGPSPHRDGDLDMEVVFHEHTHGLSNRLVGGGVGISQLQTEGMGEGWSDFYALCLLSQPADDVNGTYAAGAYASYQLSGLTQNYYYGIRRYPYCTDMTKNPLTLKDIDPTKASAHTGIPCSPIFSPPNVNSSEVHNQGEVWCVTLWDVRAGLINKLGAAAGNQMVLQLVTDGMKLSPANPTFLQARDAIIQADLVDNGGANKNVLWTAFAKRGMGGSATVPASSTTTGVTEAFDIPDSLSISPASSFTSVGPNGGPFAPGSQIYTLTNSSSGAITWNASKTQSWLTLSIAGGTLASGASVQVVATINATANGLADGTYSDTISFTDVTTSAVQTRGVTLRTGQRDYFTELFSSGNDTRNQSWLFTPNGSNNFYSVARTAATSFPTDPTGGTSLPMSDDTFVQVTPAGGVSVKLYGTSYTTFYVGSNGYVTFGSGDSSYTESLASHFNRPRISALFDDLLPSTGQVTWKQTSDRISVTWQNVSEISPSDSNSFQIEMFFDGRIQITCLGIAAQDGLIGLSQGLGTPSDYLASDFSTYSTAQLGLTLPVSATEGDGVLVGQGAVSLSPAQTSAVNVSLSSSNTGKVTVPATVTVPAGQTSATFNVTIVDNAVLDGTQTATITATAPTFASAARTIAVQDNETATLTITAPTSVSESAGSVQGAVSVAVAPANDIAVSLTSTDTTAIQVPTIATIPAGQLSANFTITVLDDNKINGTHSATITAHVANWTDGNATIAVQDNESTNLALTLPVSVVEGGTGTGTVSISGTLPTALSVSLSSNTTSRLTVPAGVTIPAGSTSATFALTAPDNSLTDGSATVTITAGASGFTNGNSTTNVLDDDAHHFVISAIGASQVRGGAISVTITAKDVNDVTVPTYTGTVALSAAGTGGADAITPTTTTGFTAGVWTGNVSVNSFDSNVVLTANDGAGHTGSSNAFNVGIGALHHFAWNTVASPQLVNTPFSATITARDAANNIVTSFNGNAGLGGVTSGGTNSTIQVLTFTGYADTTATGEYNHTKQAISTYFQNYVETATTTTDPATLATQLAGKQVFLVVEQENATTTQLSNLATSWASTISNFVNQGGIVIVCSWQLNEHEILTSAGLLNATKGTMLSSASLTKASSTVLNAGVSTPFTGSYISYYTSTNGIVDLQDASSGAPAVLHRDVGAGHVVLIGTDYYTIGTGMDHIVSNAVGWAQSSLPASVNINPTQASAFVSGTWTGNVTVQQAASQMKLRADDGSGHTGDSNPFDVVGMLAISIPPTATEGDAPVTGRVSVSATAASNLVVSLSSSDTTAAQVPATVTIPAGQTTVTFPLTIVDDHKINGTHAATITAHIAGWSDVSGTINIADNENTNLAISLPTTVAEGATGTGTVSISGTLPAALTVSLTSDTTSRLTVPANITIPAGSTTATFALTAPDNSQPDGDANVTITAGASGFSGGSAITKVLDNEVDHFSFATIASPQTKNSGFSITITARNASNAVVTGFTGTVALTANGSSSVTPAASGAFVNGIWTGTINMSSIASGVIVTATGPGGATGQSNAFDVIGNDYDYPANWPTFGNGPAHTGYQPISGNTFPYHAGWTVTYPTSTGGLNQVAISRGKAFVTPYTYFGDSYVSALDASTGSEIWRYPFVPSYSVNPPTANAGKVYVEKGNSTVSYGDSKLWCFGDANGTPLWSSAITAQWERYFAPTVVGDGVWVDGGTYGGLYGFNTADGSQRFFNSTIGQYDQWTPAYYNGTIYTWVGGSFRAHDPVTGSILWSLSLDLGTAGSPVIDQGRAYVIGSAKFYAVDLAAHTSPWSVPGTFNGSPAAANGIVYAISSGAVIAYDGQTGASVGTYVTGGSSLIGQPIVTNDSLIVTSSSATYIFNLQTHALTQTIGNGGLASLANGILYLAGSDGILRTFYPDNMVALALAIPASATEGAGTLTGTVALSRTLATDTILTVFSSDPARVSVPATVTIPAGQLSATFNLTILDDALLNGSENVVISASSSGGQVLGKYATITVNDNETATLAVTAPASVSETAGTATGTVTLSAVPAANITVALSSSDTTALQVPATVTIPAGQTSVNFTMTIVNDTKINGTHPATITAHVNNWNDGSATVNILDDENTNLVLSIGSQVTEGGSTYGYVYLSGTLTTALTVSLSSSNPSRLTVPATVTISAGSTSGYFTMTAPDNSATDGDAVVTVTASATGFTNGTGTTTVLDNDLDHFTFSTVAASQVRGAPFSVTITAQTISGRTATAYSGTAAFAASGTGGADSITPTTTGNFAAGVWTGNVTVNTFDSNVVLTANDGAGHSGSSNAFTVGVGAVHHFAWNTQPASRSVNIPFNATITAQDAGNNTVTSFAGTTALSLVGTPAEVRTIGSGTGQYVLPLTGNFLQSRDEIIYLQSELGAAGTINSLALSVSTPPGLMANFTIRMKHTGLSTLPSTGASWDGTGWTTVYQGSPTISSAGWYTFVFTTPFAYDGVSNLLIDFSHNATTTAGFGVCNATTSTRNGYWYQGSGNPDPLTWSGTTPAPSSTTGVPNVQLGIGGSSGATAVSPSTTGSFVNGVWTGNISIPQTAVHTVLRANDGSGHTGDSNAFDVLGSPPGSTTLAASAITATSVTLNGSVNANGTLSTVSFDYGPTAAYGATITGTPASASGLSATPVTASMTGLTPGTTYHFRVKGLNSYGTTNGNDLTFTTLSSNATLSNLSPSSGTLSPAFSSSTTSYTASVSNSTLQISLTPTVGDVASTVKVNGTTVASGSPSNPISLTIGNNTITTLVTAQDGLTTKTYSVAVTRRTPYQDWATNLGLSGAALDPMGDFNNSGLKNLQKWAFATSTGSNAVVGPIQVSNGTLVAHGVPTLYSPDGVHYFALFGRRKDAATVGLTYVAAFSNGLSTWSNSADIPTVIAQDSEIEAVTVPFPPAGQPQSFFRVNVTGQ
ncbi:peptidase M36 fungalysin [Chthoniobacter flavus Ellin428]|uniref:Peptidase M36 fungalysin n=1 Tax=Chthoniobacter flavus Ellin428 TaxID=497964 RepID=B4D692_9BACT|nr:M36 family metallopeptidase [Chthoniobacter flavus]EDY18001.1 peptidase M36 fungalysin [Chthoniobacter flavus Ellin428]TCO88243.1 outer membrane protein assembly factor BamB [Chthoniobacter flavus]